MRAEGDIDDVDRDREIAQAGDDRDACFRAVDAKSAELVAVGTAGGDLAEEIERAKVVEIEAERTRLRLTGSRDRGEDPTVP